MSQPSKEAPSSLIELCFRQLPPQTTYRITKQESITPTNTPKFTNSRTSLLRDLLSGCSHHPEYSTAIFAEQLVFFCLEPLIERFGFSPRLAPQVLESGGPGLKGSDLLIVRLADGQLFSSFDVKLRRTKNNHPVDPFSWNDRVKSPHFLLCLGNWQVNTREQSDLRIRDWLNMVALNQIRQNGKIPQLNELRGYVVRRLKSGVDEFSRRALSLPKSTPHLEILHTKLGAMRHLFQQISLYTN